MDHDLLVEPLLSWRDAQRRRGKTSLPGTLARLASGELGDFPRLRTHQLHPWCMFLTQLAAIALHLAGRSDPKLSENQWRQLLLRLTNDTHEPWSLVVDDLSMPGFFQPPVPEGTVSSWKICEAPDDIDMLVTAKSHDVKAGLMHGNDPETWVYAISTLQTMQGFPGRGYNRIARMKGGYGNRPMVGLTRDQTLASRFSHDVGVLLDSWSRLIDRGYRDDALSLVWTQAWDGRTSLPMHELTPHFIEVCWRVRCLRDGAGIVCHYATTQVRRCLPEAETGDVGDPWIPIERATRGALTVGSNGLDYHLLTRLIFEADFEPAAAQVARTDDRDPMLWVASALVRGQGKTEGLHERALVLTGPVRRKLGQPDGRALLGKRAQARVTAARNMRSKVLYPALKQLALGGQVAPDDLDARIDDIFFDHLFNTLPLTDEEARLAFEKRVEELAWRELQRAIDRSGVPNARRFRAISAAESMFRGCLVKNFPDLVTSARTLEGVPA
ncbi:MAG: type I-E CRISPR-associated protein Cse1/CasA [Acidobacteriota bacterium]